MIISLSSPYLQCWGSDNPPFIAMSMWSGGRYLVLGCFLAFAWLLVVRYWFLLFPPVLWMFDWVFICLAKFELSDFTILFDIFFILFFYEFYEFLGVKFENKNSPQASGGLKTIHHVVFFTHLSIWVIKGIFDPNWLNFVSIISSVNDLWVNLIPLLFSMTHCWFSLYWFLDFNDLIDVIS